MSHSNVELDVFASIGQFFDLFFLDITSSSGVLKF